MNCEICGKTRITPEGKPGGADCPGVCETCRRHAQIGAAVENFPNGCGVYHGHDGRWYADQPGSILQPEGPTPLDALRASGLVEDRSE